MLPNIKLSKEFSRRFERVPTTKLSFYRLTQSKFVKFFFFFWFPFSFSIVSVSICRCNVFMRAKANVMCCLYFCTTCQHNFRSSVHTKMYVCISGININISSNWWLVSIFIQICREKGNWRGINNINKESKFFIQQFSTKTVKINKEIKTENINYVSICKCAVYVRCSACAFDFSVGLDLSSAYKVSILLCYALR